MANFCTVIAKYFLFCLLIIIHIVFWKLVLLIDSNVRHFYPHTHKREFDVKRGSLNMDAAPYHTQKNVSNKYLTTLINLLLCWSYGVFLQHTASPGSFGFAIALHLLLSHAHWT